MTFIPSNAVISGSGKPRLVKLFASTLSDYYETAGTPTYTATTAVDSVALDSRIKTGRRISAMQTNAGFASKRCWAKVTAIDAPSKTITVDEWIGGTPTNGQVFRIDGYVADLPRSEKITETFEPDNLVHELYRGRKKTKQFGWKYSCQIVYESFFSPDTAVEMKDMVTSVIDTNRDETIVLIPRKDKPQANYNVYFESGLSVFLHPSAIGHGGVVFGFGGKENVATPSMFNSSGYGIGYGQTYGTQL